MTGSYEDMLFLPHHVSATRPAMPVADRAAQFSPFAALSGYEEAIREAARQTCARVTLDDQAAGEISFRLRTLVNALPRRHEVSLTCFVPDERKSGGRYVTVTGKLQAWKEAERLLVMEDGAVLSLEHIVAVEGPLWE